MRKLFIGLSLISMVIPGLVFSGEKKDMDKKSSEIKVPGAKDKEYYNSKFPEIGQDELVKYIKSKKVVLVDANGQESYEKAHIPGAIHFSSSDFKSKLPKDKDALIVAYCGGPGCQAWCKAADELEAQGYKNIKHYKGGIKGWLQAGLDVNSVKEKKDKKEG